MRFADNSPDPQVKHGIKPVMATDTEETTIDTLAAEMASKAGNDEKKAESDDTVGGVRSNSGGIFSK